ncbi:MAG: dynamin family protein [Phormidesmis sp.]
MEDSKVTEEKTDIENTLQSSLVTTLQRAAGLLGDSQLELKAETVKSCDRLTHPTYRVAVSGPFNYGKSTPLNALLGKKTLPMDLVPTTGAAIAVKYGPEHRTCIVYTNGSVQEEAGTAALQQHTILDEQRRMREDIAAVEAYCPHPLLKLGLELIDLPGTDDQEAQNALVQKQLLSADLVIQLLDARKLMTLAERENLRDWLLDRGINTVIFVVNFLNLMETADRQQVALRLRFLAESFRSNLPPGVSNLYPVDALPALRARLKGDMAAATQTGLPALESALQTIGQQRHEGKTPAQTLNRMSAMAKPSKGIATTLLATFQTALQSQIDALSTVQPGLADTRRTAIKTRVQALIQQGLDQSVAKLREWLVPASLQAHYRSGLAQALQQKTTPDWLLQNLRPAWKTRQKEVVRWVHQGCDFFERPRLVELWMAFAEPVVSAEVEAEPADGSKADKPGMAPVAIATGLGWILGGPLGAAVLAGTSHLVNQSGRTQQTQPMAVDFAQQADIYLERFSAEALGAIAAYKLAANQIIQTKISAIATFSPAREAQINLLKTTLSELEELLERVLEF